MDSKSAKSVRLQMVISPEEIARIDNWRRHQTPLPSRSEAIRQLIALGLEAARQKEKA
jgi:metal-responsive CopG/Arc/MetJ family transcriptional regulator